MFGRESTGIPMDILKEKIFNYYIRKHQELNASINSYMVESINNIDTIKFLSLEENINNKEFCAVCKFDIS